MNPKAKKALIFTGLGLDAAIMIFLMTVAIIMLATMPDVIDPNNPMIVEAIKEKNGAFIGTLQTNLPLYVGTCVVPLFVLLVANIVGLVFFVKKAGTKKAMLSDLSEEQKAALREELLKEMQSEKKE